MPQHQVGSRLDLGGSCGGPVCVRWRAEKQLSRWKAFDEVHGSAAERALRKDYGWLGLVGGLFNSGPMDRRIHRAGPRTSHGRCFALTQSMVPTMNSRRSLLRAKCQQSATRTKRANQGFRAHRVNLLIYKRILVALPGLEPGLFALTGRTKNSRQRRLVRSGFAAKNAPAGQRQIRTHIGR